MNGRIVEWMDRQRDRFLHVYKRIDPFRVTSSIWLQKQLYFLEDLQIQN